MSTIHENKQDNCILEDDLEYPKYLHNLHNDYPFSPEKIEIKENMLSDYHRKIANTIFQLVESKSFYQAWAIKANMFLHNLNLELWLQLGMKLTKIHRVLTFKQSH